MKLTRKQADEYVRDPANWEIIPGNEYVRAARMEFKGTTYIRFDKKSVENYFEAVIKKTEPVRTKFTPSEYTKMLEGGYSIPVSKTTITNEIYALAKEDS